MQLLIRRNQKTGLMGGAKYTLYVRAQLSDEERNLVKKNNLAGELLVYYDRDADKANLAGSLKEAGGLAGALVRKMRDTALTVAKLIEGAEITCANVGELMGVERETREAALMLKNYLDVAATFGGEEVLDMDKLLAEANARDARRA
ncbi:hypothetical protein [Methylomagnum ishizawai]|uniref:hypothetical protein n=1 Tax=Methylomagnum ishizawai TaxID=1760988 RepID=UPI001C326020|nr:hypothetical protein [Methylomagnum ishizawai]BBL77474.1 hypothetical protein MishRS11D_45720 [Methylomagnum ishizawai]